MRKKHVPLRRCVVCGAQRPKAELIRTVRTPAGTLEIDARPKMPGRGAYVCRAAECLAKAAKGKPLARSLDWPLSEEDLKRLRALAEGLSPD